MIKRLLIGVLLLYALTVNAQTDTHYPGGVETNTTTIYAGDADGDTSASYFDVWVKPSVFKPGLDSYFFIFAPSTSDPGTTDSIVVKRFVSPDRDPGSSWKTANQWCFCQEWDLRDFAKTYGTIDAGENIVIPNEFLVKGSWRYEYLIIYCNGSDTLTWTPLIVQDKTVKAIE